MVCRGRCQPTAPQHARTAKFRAEREITPPPFARWPLFAVRPVTQNVRGTDAPHARHRGTSGLARNPHVYSEELHFAMMHRWLQDAMKLGEAILLRAA